MPKSEITQPALDYLAHFYPAPNRTVFPNDFVAAQSTAVNSDQWGLKFDHRFGDMAADRVGRTDHAYYDA